ncbi:ADP-ribose pyrophosphatase [Vibrio phage 207E48.1]|nr:ADP-ribose pyrophosphatase [Vibrio phage 207E48.1]
MPITILKNRFMHVEQDDNGMVTFDRNATQHGSIVVPVTPEGKVMLISEYRVGAQAHVVSVVKGAADNMEESYEDIARRELAEELGVECATVTVTHCEPFALPAFTRTRGRVCIAHWCEVTKEQNLEEGEHISLYGVFSKAEVRIMIANGTINDSESIAALSLWLIPVDNGVEPYQYIDQ